MEKKSSPLCGRQAVQRGEDFFSTRPRLVFLCYFLSSKPNPLRTLPRPGIYLSCHEDTYLCSIFSFAGAVKAEILIKWSADGLSWPKVWFSDAVMKGKSKRFNYVLKLTEFCIGRNTISTLRHASLLQTMIWALNLENIDEAAERKKPTVRPSAQTIRELLF